jgi:hypothetical protein
MCRYRRGLRACGDVLYVSYLSLPAQGSPPEVMFSVSPSASTSDLAAEFPVESSSGTGPKVAWRHHYVPCFLLAGFTPSGRQSDQLWSFDRERIRPERRAPKAIAFERDYYAVEAPGQPSDLVETYFSQVETIAAPTIRDMIANRVIPTGTDYANLMYFLGLMKGRSPAFRDALVRFEEERIHNLVKLLASSRENYEVGLRGFPADKKKPTFDMIQKWAAEEKFVEVANPSVLHVQGAMLGLDGRTIDLLGNRKWSLLFAEEGDVQFLCSDNPISIRSSRAPFERFVPPGIAYRGTDFILPIHRRVALLGRFEGRSEVHDVGDEVVASINTRTMRNARRYVFASEREFYVVEPDGSIVPGSVEWLRPTSDPT